MPQTKKSKAKLIDLAESFGTETFTVEEMDKYEEAALAKMKRIERINKRRELIAEIAITIIGLLGIAGICALMIKLFQYVCNS